MYLQQPNIRSVRKILNRLITMPTYPSKTRLSTQKAPPFSALILRLTIEPALRARSFPIRATIPLLLKAKQMQKPPQVNHINGTTLTVQEFSKMLPVTNRAPKNTILVGLVRNSGLGLAGSVSRIRGLVPACRLGETYAEV